MLHGNSIKLVYCILLFSSYVPTCKSRLFVSVFVFQFLFCCSVSPQEFHGAMIMCRHDSFPFLRTDLVSFLRRHFQLIKCLHYHAVPPQTCPEFLTRLLKVTWKLKCSVPTFLWEENDTHFKFSYLTTSCHAERLRNDVYILAPYGYLFHNSYVSYRLETSLIRVRSQIRLYEIYCWRSGSGPIFLRIIRFLTSVLIPPTVPIINNLLIDSV